MRALFVRPGEAGDELPSDPDAQLLVEIEWSADGKVTETTRVYADGRNVSVKGGAEEEQPRYGAGPLISAGAELLCTMIEVQRELKAPIGRLLQRLGHKPPRTWVADPIEILKNTRRGRKLLPRLRIEWVLQVKQWMIKRVF